MFCDVVYYFLCYFDWLLVCCVEIEDVYVLVVLVEICLGCVFILLV